MMLHSYVQRQADLIASYMSTFRTVLDYGCGDMQLDRILIKNNPRLHITGVDVCPFSQSSEKRLTFQQYAGDRLPFRDHSFDGVYAYHVFHHTNDPRRAFAECVRVAKKKIIIVEPVLRYPLEKIGFCLMDTLTNIWKSEGVPLPFTIQTLPWWKRTFQTNHLRCMVRRNVSLLPTFLPIGETMLFVVEK